MASETRPEVGQHSPRPWKASHPEEGSVIYASNGEAVAQTFSRRDEDFENAPANNRLIEGAPDLLAEHEEWSRRFAHALILVLQDDYSAIDALALELPLGFRDGSACIDSPAIDAARGRAA